METETPIEEPHDYETYEIILRVAAKLLAYRAMKYRKEGSEKGERWLLSAAQADFLADEYKVKSK